MSVGTGIGGSDVIQGRIPLAQLGNPSQVQIIATSDVGGRVDVAGNRWAGITLRSVGTATQPVPATGALALGLLLLAVFALSFVAYRRRYGHYHWVLLVMVLPVVLTAAWALTWTTIVTDAAESGNGGDIRQLRLAADGSALHIQLHTHIGTPAPTGKLNDTGITWGGNYPSGNNSNCTGAEIAAQDCSHGRDAAALAGTLTKVGGGRAGFDFTKLDSSGNNLSATATTWSCVRDNVTGLVWEVKDNNGGLHDKNNTYTWYNPDNSNNGGVAGTQNGGTCSGGGDCDTASLVTAVNAAGLCGQNDWRVPAHEELRSIVNYSRYNPAIDTDYFPNTQYSSSWPYGFYWSSSPHAGSLNHAWGVRFYSGSASYYSKYGSRYVRLVRGGQ